MLRKSCALLLLLCLATVYVRAAAGEAPPTTIVIDIPDYAVERRGGWDYVDIPGGDALLVEGRPRIPYYSASISYPSGYRIQEVAMREKSGLVAATGLNLSIVTAAPRAQSAPPATAQGGWYPEGDFGWAVWINSDGSSTLVIDVYPFHYRPETMEARFYKHYDFDVLYAFSAVSIDSLATDKDAYDPGEEVLVSVLLDCPERPENLVASALVKLYASDEVVAGLPLRTIHDASGAVSFSMVWDSAGFPTGDYYVEVTLNDTSGNWLDRRTRGFRVGRPLLNVTGFSVGPLHFDIGDEVRMELDVVNAGSIRLAGTCVFRIEESGITVEEFRNNFSSLAVGNVLTFENVWKTSAAKRGAVYNVIAYVSYESQTTPPMTATLSTNLFPVSEFIPSSSKVGLGEGVTFDASGSRDPDGTITSFEWAFGDGGSGEGERVSHAYHELGYYEVFLTVKDNEGAASQSRGVIEAVMTYTLNITSNVGATIQGAGKYREGEEATLSAPPSVGMPGIIGLLGGKYVFKGWSGPLNSTESTVRLVFEGNDFSLEMRATYAEDYSVAIISSSTIAIVITAIVALSLRGRKMKGIPPKPP